MYSCFDVLFNNWYKIIYTCTGADPEIFQRGIEEENFGRKMFVDTRINACIHIKTRQTCNSFSLLPFQGDCPLYIVMNKQHNRLNAQATLRSIDSMSTLFMIDEYLLYM